MRTHEQEHWRPENGNWWRTWILAFGVAVAIVLAYRPAYPGQDGMGGVYSGVFAGSQKGRTKAVASPELVEILEAAPDGDMTKITISSPSKTYGIVTYRVQPKSSFRVGEQNCRTFTIRAASDTQISETFRIACKRANGAWHVAMIPPAGDGS